FASCSTNFDGTRPLCLAASGDALYAGAERAGVKASHDNGQSWVTLNHGLGPRTVRSLLPVGGHLFAGTDADGVFRSNQGTNGAGFASWNEGLPALAQVHQIASSGDSIFAALYSKGLYRRPIAAGPWERVGTVSPL